MFFILSTGRCGSTTIARLLDQFHGVSCSHEPHPRLIEESIAYIEGRMSKKEAVALLRSTRGIYDSNVIIGESNNRLALFSDALYEAFPDAHYIWLVRSGLDVVASFDHRRLYRGTNNIWGRNMPCGDSAGDLSSKEWNKLSPFGRCCWRWSWTNKKIKASLEEANVKSLYVRLEDLSDMVSDLGEFLGAASKADISVPISNASKSKVSRYSYWDREQRRIFESQCGLLMDELYPRWRKKFVFSGKQKIRNELLSYLSNRKLSGQLLRYVTRNMIPEHIQKQLAKPFTGRGVLNHPNYKR